MIHNELSFGENNELGFKRIKIIDMEKADDYLFILLDNEQKILTNGDDFYDVSLYSHLLY